LAGNFFFADHFMLVMAISAAGPSAKDHGLTRAQLIARGWNWQWRETTRNDFAQSRDE
jgi:hypothetical protein